MSKKKQTQNFKVVNEELGQEFTVSLPAMIHIGGTDGVDYIDVKKSLQNHPFPNKSQATLDGGKGFDTFRFDRTVIGKFFVEDQDPTKIVIDFGHKRISKFNQFKVLDNGLMEVVIDNKTFVFNPKKTNFILQTDNKIKNILQPKQLQKLIKNADKAEVKIGGLKFKNLDFAEKATLTDKKSAEIIEKDKGTLA